MSVKTESEHKTWFDIGEKYNPGRNYTIAALCKELMAEDERQNKNNDYSEEDYRKKIKNSQGSGLINKLISCMNFDIESIAKRSAEDNFAALKLLKLLYRTEKDSLEKDSKTIKFTDIMEKPRLDNILTDLSDKSTYGAVFSEIMEKIGSEVSDAGVRRNKIEEINAYWEFITDEVMQYVVSDSALEHHLGAIDELNRLEKVLSEKVLDRIKESHLKAESYKDGVMETFYNILCCHRMLCSELDRIRINYQVCFEEAPSREYCDKFLKNEKWVLSDAAVPCVKDMLNGKNEGDEGTKLIMYLLSYGKEIAKEDKKYYEFALKHYGTVVQWMEKNTDVDNSHGIFLTEFVSIIQEIVAVYKNDERFHNDYFGNKYTNKPLLSAIKKPDKADAVFVQAWIKKVQNRLSINFGVRDLIMKERDIEIKIYNIKSEIYRYQNLDDLEFVNAEVFHFATLPVISRGQAINMGDKFAHEIAKAFRKDVKLSVIMPPDGINILNMFREFIMDRTNVMPLVAKDIARQLEEFYQDYQEDDYISAQGMRCDFETSVVNGKFRDYVCTFMVSRDRHNTNICIEYRNFAGIVPDEHADRMEALGLEKFVKNDAKMY